MKAAGWAVNIRTRWPLALLGIVLGVFLAAAIVTASPERAIAASDTAAALSPAPQLVPAPKAAPDGSSQDRQYLGEDRCAACHEAEASRYRESAHARDWNPRSPAAAQACETCHGPGREHFVDPEAPGLIKHFPVMSPAEVNETCMTCHNREEHALWQGSMHDARNLSCVSCHSMHGSRSEPMLRRASVTETCAQCHRDKAAKVLRSNHMPVREGKLECTTCHNQHGSTNVRLLRVGNTVNETCVSCHTEKRGPFLWEHAPVQENCTTCHDPHGSSNDRMLVAKAPMLCQRCHVTTRHPVTIYGATEVASRNNRIVSRACVNCHSNIHGSNHPSGLYFQR